MMRRIFAVGVMASLLALPLGAASNCWFESYDPPIEHCDPPCGDIIYHTQTADFDDGSSITRLTRRCELNDDLVSCERTIHCNASAPTCAAECALDVLPC